MHTIKRDGYSTVLKTTVEHSAEAWNFIDRFMALDALTCVRDPAGVTSAIEYAAAAAAFKDAEADYARSVSPGSAGDLRNALYAHLGRIQYEAADKADVEWVA